MNHRAFVALTALALLTLPVSARAADTDDVVLLANGGRIRGEVIEQDPVQGLRIKLADGTIRVLKASDVREVKYHDAAPAPEPVAPAAVAAAPVVAAPQVVTSVAPPVSDAPEQRPFKRFDIALRSTFAVPFGKYDDTTREDGSEVLLSDSYHGQVGFALELGVWVTPRFMLGVVGHYGIMALKTGDKACPGKVTCSEHETRFGLQGHYHFSPDAPIDPWLGFGLGYQNIGYSWTYQGQTTEGNITGPEYLNLQFGTSFAVSPAFALSPVLALSVGQFTKYSSDTAGEHTETDIEKTALHQWLSLGVRGAFRL